MARYKHIHTSPRFFAVDLQRQLIPGTIEHALNQLLDHEIDLTHFAARFRNDVTGATAYLPASLPVTGLLHCTFRRHSPALQHPCQLCQHP